MTDTVVLPLPQLVGTDTVAAALGISRSRLYHLIWADHPRIRPGYLGKIAERHTWNAHELFSSMFTSTMALVEEIERVEAGIRSDRWCSAPGCDEPAQFLDLCRVHVWKLHRAFGHAENSSLAMWRLLAMCKWVVERNQHLAPPDDWDPWSGVCMTPGCENDTRDALKDRSSPLCPDCSAKFWSVARRGTL